MFLLLWLLLLVVVVVSEVNVVCAIAILLPSLSLGRRRRTPKYRNKRSPMDNMDDVDDNAAACPFVVVVVRKDNSG